MKPRWIIITISCLALACSGAMVWYLVHAQLIDRRLAKQAAASRLRAEQGDAESQFKLGSMYALGRGVSKDYAEAVRWFRRSAEQGCPKAEYSLSDMYRGGKGVPQDYSQAANWCRKAAEQGYATAQEALGYLYFRGEGVPQDYAEAARWYRKSAEQGTGDGQYMLGYMYYYGDGLPQDRAEAARWFQQAATHGNEDARRALGLNKTHPAASKVYLPLELIGGILFWIFFLKSEQSFRSRAQIVTGLAALLLICSFVLGLFWYSYVGHLQSPMASTAVYFARHLLGGVLVALLLSMIVANSAKITFISAVVLFTGFVVFRIIHCGFNNIPLTLRLLCFVAFPIGMATTALVFLWLDHKKSGSGLERGPSVPIEAK